MSSKNLSFITVVLLITLGFVSRLLPHPANFAPISAIAIFSGLYLPKRWAIVLPILAMFVSDIFIGFYTWQIMVAVYGSFILSGLLGLQIRNRKSVKSVILVSVLVSVSFFIITNFAVWTFSNMYVHSLSGLIQCYTMAIPFFKNTLLGDLFYTGALVGIFEGLTRFASYDRIILNRTL